MRHAFAVELPAPAPPIAGESPSSYAARAGELYLGSQHQDARRALGQFFTTPDVARFMARMARPGRKTRTVLDPGAGSGILACALLEELPAEAGPVHVLAYEVDPGLARVCEASLAHAQLWLSSRGTAMTFEVRCRDFVSENGGFLASSLFDVAPEQLFDVAILNPPYFKLTKSDPRARAAAEIVHGQPNIYAAFLAIAARLLGPRGVMVSITPRSFATGDYFSRFREYLFRQVSLEGIHLFASRSSAFEKDAVLQENVILRARKGLPIPTVRISTSAGTADLSRPRSRQVPVSEVLDARKGFTLHIQAEDADDDVRRFVSSWPETLGSLGLLVSTGPVVAFRARPFLRHHGQSGAVPLLWLAHVQQMQVVWPLPKTSKPQFMEASAASEKLLVPRGNYVVMRRFSAKEEACRLVAAPLLETSIAGAALGLENHLNYVYRQRGAMSPEETTGLAAVLGSSLLDRYFRLSNGSTQVNATELRRLPLPRAEDLKRIGLEVLDSADGPAAAGSIVEKVLDLPTTLRAKGADA
ncbi:MAG: Eco57I restriction-modification methylase domain-containing protein [Acidobacteria bacterium]|nr:Eco57I restriction-modification methylase domain-containing protein [Acidobacteriota bacterium]